MNYMYAMMPILGIIFVFQFLQFCDEFLVEKKYGWALVMFGLLMLLVCLTFYFFS